MTPRMSVVIPTWNRCDLATTCLHSLEMQTFRDFETILVDDGSTDDTVRTVQRDFPKVRIESLKKNRGFAIATNTGIRAARGEWLFLLNNDVTLAPDCLERLLASAETQRAHMVAPLIFWQENPDLLYSAGDRIRINGRPEAIGFRRPRNEFPLPARIFGVGAAAGLYHRRIFDTVGLLDEKFVAYFEDSDLCFRARLAGFTAALAADASASHAGSATLRGKTWWRSAQCFRNHALLVIKNMPLPLFLQHAPVILAERVHQARQLFSSARVEFGAARALGLLVKTGFSIAQCLPHALRERRRIQRSRRINLRDLEALLAEEYGP